MEIHLILLFLLRFLIYHPPGISKVSLSFSARIPPLISQFNFQISPKLTSSALNIFVKPFWHPGLPEFGLHATTKSWFPGMHSQFRLSLSAVHFWIDRIIWPPLKKQPHSFWITLSLMARCIAPGAVDRRVTTPTSKITATWFMPSWRSIKLILTFAGFRPPLILPPE